MSATIRVGTFEATIEGWQWAGDNPAFVGMLNARLDPVGPSGADPAPDYHEALRVVEEIGGEVIDYELPEYVRGRIY